MLRRVRVLVVLVTLAVALAAGAAGASAANWAGLGDSYAAGPLIPNQQLNPLGCLRSDHNFAHLAAAALGRSLADVSCSGAKTDDMTAPQNVTPGPNPPQFQRAHRDDPDRDAADRRQRHVCSGASAVACGVSRPDHRGMRVSAPEGARRRPG
jgi:hypothetical protein